jgi:cellobiose epimerase
MNRIYLLLLLTISMFSCRGTTEENQTSGQDTTSGNGIVPSRKEIAQQMENSLQKETLSKWYPQCVDHEYGGYFTSYTHDFKLKGDQHKMIVSQARHTWVNAKASLLYPSESHYKDGATYGFKFLRNAMWDKTFGGFYTLVSREGRVLDESKNAYGNAFGIFALAAYYQSSQDSAALNLAKKAFLWLEKNSHDSVHKGYFQHLRRDGSRIMRNTSVDSHAETGYKDQNSSIHLLEAFAELYQVWPDPLLRERLQEMLFLIRDTITTDKGYMVLFFTPEWKRVSYRDSPRNVIDDHHNLDHVSFGHDIETAYLLLEASHVLGIHNDTATIKVAKRMVDHSLKNGWDNTVGGFFDEGYYFKGDAILTITHDTKNWWAQAEGMNTLLIFADLFPDDPANYYDKFRKQWSYIDKYLIDHEHGDWYAGGLDKEPHQKTMLKGHQWKTTYHHFRSMANCIKRLRGE